VFEEVEEEMVKRVFRLGDRRVVSLMTPRPDIVWLDANDRVKRCVKNWLKVATPDFQSVATALTRCSE
jgi:CBS domain containing-hemolysin-like protein